MYPPGKRSRLTCTAQRDCSTAPSHQTVPSLEHFQTQTTTALLDSHSDCPDAVAGSEQAARTRRFNVYRNNRAVSLIENLQATYPAAEKLVGSEFFTAVARAYIDAHPPSSPVMAEFGAGFGAFMAALPTTQSIPYITDVARVEWCRNEAYHAADSDVLSLDALASLPPEALPDLLLSIHPAVRIVNSRWPAGSIWADSQAEATEATAIDMRQGECVVIARPTWEVQVSTLAPSTAAFLHDLMDNQTIGHAAASVLQHDPEFDAGANLGHLFGLGLFSSYRTGTPST
ncbi:MAG: DNA-binding domain-containing protein [Pseudomonadota bacterium]